VAHQGHVTRVQGRHHARQTAPLHRRAVADERFADAGGREQPRRHASVLRRDRADLAEHTHRAGTDILEIPNGRRDYEKRAHPSLASQGCLVFAEPYLVVLTAIQAWRGGGVPPKEVLPPL